MENETRRKIWRMGSRRKGKHETKGSYILTLPHYVGDKIKEAQDNEVIISSMDDSIIITFLSALKEPRKMEVKITPLTETALENQIMSAYLSGYDYIELNGNEKSSDIASNLVNICTKLPGAWFNTDTGNKFRVNFSNKVENINVPSFLDDRLQKCYGLCKEMYEINNNDMKNFPVQTIEIPGKIERNEAEIDKVSFEVKRTLAILTCYPERYNITNLKTLRNLYEYSGVISYFEHFSDLQREISEILRILTKKDKSLITLISDFERYYTNAYNMIQDAYNERENFQKVNEIVRTKKDSKEIDGAKEYLEFRHPFITFEQRYGLLKACENYVENKPAVSRELTILEQDIWGITRIATNIAEAWCNIGQRE